jgi:hypothetical protein
VSIRFQADNDLKRIIVDATLRREASIDFQTAQAAGLDRLDDEMVLRRASEQGRIVVSHDKRTMPQQVAAFLAQGGNCPGVLLVIPQHAPVRDVAETLVLIWADNRPDEWVNPVTKIPFLRYTAPMRRDLCIWVVGHVGKSVKINQDFSLRTEPSSKGFFFDS